MNMLTSDKSIILRYISGEATPEEAVLVDEWTHAAPENKEAFDALWRQWYIRDQAGYQAPDISQDWQRVKRGMQTRRPVFRWRMAAAVVGGVVMTGLVYFLIARHSNQLVTRFSGEKIRRDSLPGGISITLDAFGTMGYPKGNGNHDSVVLINGRAYICTTLRPVTVGVGGLVVYANSCDFLLSYDTASGATSISVFRGLLEVIERTRRLIIKEGHQLLFHADTRQFTDRQAVDVNDISFATGRYHFENVSLQKAMDVLSRDYRVAIRFANHSLENCRISGDWDRKEDIRAFMEVLTYVLDIKYEVLQHGKVYALSGPGCED